MLQIQCTLIHIRNPTKAQKIHCIPHNNSGRPQQPTLNNGQIMEIETEQGHSETSRGYEPIGIDWHLQNISSHNKRIHLLLSTSRHLLQNWPYNRSQYKPQWYKKVEILPCILSDHHGLRLVFNNNKDNKNPQYTWNINNALLKDSRVKEEIKKETKDFLEFNKNEKNNKSKPMRCNESKNNRKTHSSEYFQKNWREHTLATWQHSWKL